MEDRRCRKNTAQEGSPDSMLEVIAHDGTAETWPDGDEERLEGWALNWDTAALAGLPHPLSSISR